MTYKLITETELQQAITMLDTGIPVASRRVAAILRAVMEREGPACHGSYQHRETGAHVTVYTLPDEPTT